MRNSSNCSACSSARRYATIRRPSASGLHFRHEPENIEELVEYVSGSVGGVRTASTRTITPIRRCSPNETLRRDADREGHRQIGARDGSTLTAPLTQRRLLSRLKAYVRKSKEVPAASSDEAFTAGLAAQKHLLRALFTADAVGHRLTVSLETALPKPDPAAGSATDPARLWRKSRRLHPIQSTAGSPAGRAMVRAIAAPKPLAGPIAPLRTWPRIDLSARATQIRATACVSTRASPLEYLIGFLPGSKQQQIDMLTCRSAILPSQRSRPMRPITIALPRSRRWVASRCSI